MKKTGLIILVVGLIITLFTAFNLVTQVKVVEKDKSKISVDKKHGFASSPQIGFAVMILGQCAYLYGTKKQ